MLKLYKDLGTEIHYWESWENNDGSHMIHWGKLGTRGDSKVIKATSSQEPREIIQEKVYELTKDGYSESENRYVLLIEYIIKNDFGSEEDLAKRHKLEKRMNETLGWVGVGHCDGGSIGMGTMEVCNFVVDFEIAKSVIEEDLKGTVFADYSRIYLES